MESSPRRFSFLGTRSMSSLRAEAKEGLSSRKPERRGYRMFSGLDVRGTIGKANDATAASESVHSRWSSSASTVRERFLDDRASRRASECHAKAFSPVLADGQSRMAHISLDDIHESPVSGDSVRSSRRFTRRARNADANLDTPPELPLLRMSSFPDMVAAASLSLSNCTPESTPLTMSDSFTISDTSSFKGLVGFASEFPQPPSLSPALRRMQSAPWLKDVNASFDASADYSWRRASQVTERSRDAEFSFTRASTEFTSQRNLLDLDDLQKGSPLDRLREDTRTGNAPWSKTQTSKIRTTDDIIEWSKSSRPHNTNVPSLASNRRNRTESSPTVVHTNTRQPLSKRADGRRNTVSSIASPGPGPALVEKTRTIRKVASMQSQSQSKLHTENGASQRAIPKIKSLRLFPATSHSKHGNTQAIVPTGASSSEAHAASKSRNWLFLRAPSAAKLARNSSTSTKHTSHGSRSSMDVTAANNVGAKQARRISRGNRTPYPHAQHQEGTQDVQGGSKVRVAQKTGRRQFRESAPHLPGLGLTNYRSLLGSKSSVGLGMESTGSPEQLDGPFALRKSRTSAALNRESESHSECTERHAVANTSVETSTSFMDITPERTGKVEKAVVVEHKRDRVKRFIAKASNGFIEWSRGLASGTKGGSGKGQTPP